MILATQSRQPRRGATAVEMAAVIGVFILLLFGILEYCLIIFTQNVVENAAREGCRAAIVNTSQGTLVNDTKNVVKNFMFGINDRYPNYSCEVYLANATGANIGSAPNAKFGEYVCVDVKVDYKPMTPGLLYLTQFTIRSKCSMGSEAN